MATKRAAEQFQLLARRPHATPARAETIMVLRSSWHRRSMATVHEQPLQESLGPSSNSLSASSRPSNLITTVSAPDSPSTQPPDTVLTTTHSFPSMEPLRFDHYPRNQLYLPLRRDILHRAVVYEASRSRQGTASTKWRDEVHGSHRKIQPQKGLGRARVGDKQSPIRRGGGVAFGPKPRDFSIGLPKKIYDKAFRTALSYRYRRGELLLFDSFRSPQINDPTYISEMFAANRWGNAHGRSLLVAEERRDDIEGLWTGVESVGWEGRIVDLQNVDVKMLLEMGRVILEQRALDGILRRHSRDLARIVGPMESSQFEDEVAEVEDGEFVEASA